MNYWDDYRPGYEDEYEPDWEADKNSAVQWAKDLFKKRFIILDTETTGLDLAAEAIQIAIINKDGHILFDSLIKPNSKIPTSAIEIHGINNQSVINAPEFVTIYPRIKSLLETFPSVIYNASFDQRILLQQCKMNNLAEINFAPSCAMFRYSEYYGDWSDYHQSYTWQRLPGGDHSALGDCFATLNVLKGMAGAEVK